MRVIYQKQVFDFQLIPSGQRYFARSGNTEMWIAPHVLRDFIRRGVMYIVSVPKDENDPGVVLGWKCEVCNGKWESKPESREKCSGCGRAVCSECRATGNVDTCDVCDEPICVKCWRGVAGAKICLKVACKDQAKELHAEAQKIAEDRRKTAAGRSFAARRKKR